MNVDVWSWRSQLILYFYESSQVKLNVNWVKSSEIVWVKFKNLNFVTI